MLAVFDKSDSGLYILAELHQCSLIILVSGLVDKNNALVFALRCSIFGTYDGQIQYYFCQVGNTLH